MALNKLSRYTVSGGSFSAGTIQLNGGTYSVLPGYDGALRVIGVTGSSGAIDLGDAAMIVDYSGASPILSLRQLLVTGYAAGHWNGAGINSSSAAIVGADSANLHKTAIGFAEASAVNIGTFAGQGVDTTSVLLRYTFSGDANLDGTVDSADFTLMSQHFNSATQLWSQGDFNYDGVVNALDFNAIAGNFGQTFPPTVAALVPEPIAVVTILSFALLTRRRQRAKCRACDSA